MAQLGIAEGFAGELEEDALMVVKLI